MSFSTYQATTKLALGGDEGKRNGAILKVGDQIRFDGSVVEVVDTGETFVNPTVQNAITAGDLVLVFTEAGAEADALTPFVVGPTGSAAAYTSIKAAVDAAGLVATPTTPQTVLVRPGTYTETALISLSPNVSVEGVVSKSTIKFMESDTDASGAVTVTANWSIVNTSAQDDEWVSLSNMKLFAYDVSLPIINISTNAGDVHLRSLFLEGTAADTSTALLVFAGTSGASVVATELHTLIFTAAHKGVSSTAGTFVATDSSFSNGASDANSRAFFTSGGNVRFYGCQTAGRIETDGGGFNLYNCVLSGESPMWSDNPLQITSGSAGVFNCFLRGIGNVDGWPIEGAGTLKVANSCHEGGYVDASATLTVTRLSEPSVIVSASASFTVNVNNNAHPIYALTAAGARAVNLPLSSNVTKDRRVTIVDSAGTAAAGNITVSGNGSNINGAGTFVMNVNNQSTSFIYDGTDWWSY